MLCFLAILLVSLGVISRTTYNVKLWTLCWSSNSLRLKEGEWMGYNDKNMIKDLSGKTCVPQYYSPITDQWEPVEGDVGAQSVLERFIGEQIQ